MEAEMELPKWYSYYQPVHPVTADCTLEWPDEKNCNEFPIICPIHGALSRWCLKCPLCTCLSPEVKSKQTVVQEKSKTNQKSIKSIDDALRCLWGGENVPCLIQQLNSGSAADSVANRRVMFNGSHLSVTPRGPVIVNSHSLKALDEKTKRKPVLDISKLKLGLVYAYVRDLDLFSEWCSAFKSEIRKFPPKDVNFQQQYKEITVYRKYHRTGLLVNIFPGVKCFVTNIDYEHFEIRPDLHYGDQIMEFCHCILQSENAYLSRNPQEHDVFGLRVRACPFLQWLTIAVGPCPIVTDSTHYRGKRSGQRSHRDLGFSLHHGCVTAVAVNSPAAEAGLKPDHHIVEVDGQFVAFHKDAETICLIRHAISDSCSRSVVIAVIPERIHQKLRTVNNLHYVSTNRGFNLDAWVKAEAFGFWTGCDRNEHHRDGAAYYDKNTTNIDLQI
ncbi:unnamed protein product [Echinostoma caproni]|uniref:PDZ domain-containing protein n=1 Tax=Echinostoma caproni TaxID=27848 RepID=A0A183AZF1_9TREM|nr:unnamed protein product [Echinostoma caproni]